jgi:small-conductance mechanosensitive channel
MDTSLLQMVFFGNSLLDYLISAGVFLAIFFLFLIFRLLVRKQIERSSAFQLLYRILPLSLLAAIYFAFGRLNLGESVEKFLDAVLAFFVALILVKGIILFLRSLVSRWAATHSEDEAGQQEQIKRYRPVLTFFNLVVWLFGAVFFLGNLGFDVSAVVAGLGVSGIAVAIAAQGILGDLFNYFVILLDRPFEVGDFIIFGDKMGGVEKIGIKTTRIRSISGEQLVVSNSALTGSKIHNYKRMQRRRIVFQTGVTYQTPRVLLQEIPAIIRSIIDSLENVTADRVHFRAFGDYALLFETVYYVESPDYALYMDIQQDINLKMAEAFEQRGIEFAYPTQVLHLAGNRDE